MRRFDLKPLGRLGPTSICHSNEQLTDSRPPAPAGHAHVIEEQEGVTVFNHLGTRYTVAEEPVTLRHEEHGTQTLPPGTYRVDHVQEFDYERLERHRVRD